MDIYNHDICGFIRRLDRYIFELHKSVSSGLQEYNTFDLARYDSYMFSCRSFLAWVVSQPQLDVPESHPETHKVDDDQALADVENEDVNDLIRLWKTARKELLHSASARKPAGLSVFDHARCIAILDKMDAFKNNYILVSNPIDLPESAPRLAMSGPGRQGV